MKPARYCEKAPPPVLAASGLFLCRCGCGREAHPPRKCWFSQDCVDSYMIRHSGRHLRKAVRKRDRGVCRACGLNCIKLRAEMRSLRKVHGTAALQLMVAQLGLHDFKLTQSYWTADHVIPVAEGGGQCALTNLQTLCKRCHHLKSVAEVARRARRKREKVANLGVRPRKSATARRQARKFARRR